MKCKICDKQLKGSGQLYCSDRCKEIAHKEKQKRSFEKYASELSGIENVDYVVCKWCGMNVKRIYGIHIKNHHIGKTVLEYKKEFPTALLTCKIDKDATSKNSGLHMKLDKYRQMASDKVSGENNPNHKSKTTEIERKSRSPFSREFYRNKNFKESEINKIINNFVTDALKNRLTETNIDYWLERFDDDSARKLYKERQSTFTLEKCILKYGEDVGKEIFQNRQTNWKNKVFNEFSCISCGTSKLAKEMCKLINEKVPNILYDKYEKFIYDKEAQRVFKYDITLKEKRKIIEINGIFWHCKPGLYEPTYYHKIKKKTAKEIWEFDEYKIATANRFGYDVLVVWEDDYNKDPDGVIKKCVEFLNEKTN